MTVKSLILAVTNGEYLAADYRTSIRYKKLSGSREGDL
jgi:hypothetical protein